MSQHDRLTNHTAKTPNSRTYYTLSFIDLWIFDPVVCVQFNSWGYNLGSVRIKAYNGMWDKQLLEKSLSIILAIVNSSQFHLIMVYVWNLCIFFCQHQWHCTKANYHTFHWYGGTVGSKYCKKHCGLYSCCVNAVAISWPLTTMQAPSLQRV